MTERREVVLVTGCSAGIGRATALAAARAGHTVVATARRLNDLSTLGPELHRVELDVDDPGSIDAAVRRARELTGGLTALVNNAGLTQPGPVELVPDDLLRQQMETNLLGPLRLIRAVVPEFRANGHGTIVNVGSVTVRAPAPFLGAYAASKAALSAVNDALRVEVAPFGIRVVLVEPGPISTRAPEIATVEPMASLVFDESSPYHDRVRSLVRNGRHIRRLTGRPERVARVIVASIESERPQARQRVAVPWGAVGLAELLPQRLIDGLQTRLLDREPERRDHGPQ